MQQKSAEEISVLFVAKIFGESVPRNPSKKLLRQSLMRDKLLAKVLMYLYQRLSHHAELACLPDRQVSASTNVRRTLSSVVRQADNGILKGIASPDMKNVGIAMTLLVKLHRSYHGSCFHSCTFESRYDVEENSRYCFHAALAGIQNSRTTFFC